MKERKVQKTAETISFKDEVMLSSTVIDPSYLEKQTPQLPNTAQSSEVMGELTPSKSVVGRSQRQTPSKGS